MLNYIWAAMIFIGILYGAINGTMKEITEAALQSAGEAVSLCISMAGIMAFWVGLMEIADDEFIRVRDTMNNYTETIREKIKSDCAGDVLIDIVSINEYMQLNKKMQSFIAEIAAIEGSEIAFASADNYINQLKWLKIETIGDLQEALDKNKELALKLAEKALKGSELDILVSNTALRFLCRAVLLSGGYTEEQAAEFISLSVRKKERAERQAKHLFKMYTDIKQD